MATSDFKINCKVRSVFARHWLDLQRVRFASFRGTVRVQGELVVLGGEGRLEPTKIEVLETEIRRIGGVKRIVFDLANWRRAASGNASTNAAAKE